MDDGAGLMLLARRIGATAERAGAVEGLAVQAGELTAALHKLGAATRSAWATGVPEEALANATPYLQAFGHVVLAWLWLDVALAAARSSGALGAFGEGKLAAMRYFYAYELPRIDAWLGVVSRRESLVREVPEDAF
jgi:butyryl-CoA dehydrogenase